MALQKQPLNINFSEGLDLKSDPKQVRPGKFLRLVNSIFTKMGLLQKRNGNKQLPSLPDSSSILATTFNGNLTSIGTSFQAYSQASQTWVNKGSFQAVGLSTLPLVRSNLNQIQTDTAMSPNGLVCTVFTETGGTTSPNYKYVVADSTTGQNIVAPTVIVPSSGAVSGSPRVFTVGNYFVIVYTVSTRLEYIAVNATIPTTVTAPNTISSTYTPASTVNFDGFVANNSLYLAWNGSDGGGAIRMTYLTSTLNQGNTVVFSGRSASIMSVCADLTTAIPVIYAAFYNLSGTTGYVLAVDSHLNTVLAPTQIITSGTVLNITSSAQNGVCTVFYEVSTAYSYDSGIKTNIINSRTVTQAGTVGSVITKARSLGLASKAFISSGNIYFLGIYNSPYQPTYFLMNSSGNVVSTLAYSNGGSYYTLGLPSVYVSGTTAKFSYFYKDLISSVNKSMGAASTAGVYSQTGINLVSYNLGAATISTAEIGNNLNLTGGFLWMYDGYAPVEQNFFLWPDFIELTGSTTGGSMSAQQYFYQVTYEWSDNQGNVFRSAPSIPVSVTTTGTTSSVTVNVPTLRLTYKTANPVKIVIYRWSTAQETFFQVTSITSPTLNSVTSDSIAFVDTLADSSIIGNNILYTTGGVVEDIGPPSFIDLSLYKSRLWGIDSEDRSLLWYSKQVIEATPVEMSDLFTLYVAPTTGAQGSTGGLTCTVPMDDKLILFKRDAAYYLIGTGPDNTGANNDFSEPVFITSTVGCSNKNSIVFIPQGLMFQSDKGIWLLGRDLSTQYIGAPVEDFNQYTVQSAVNVPGTNQVRFTMSNGITLMYDYFFGQWGTFEGVSAISSTLYQNLHTYINSFGKVFQENVGSYLDGSSPVLMSFTTSWLNLAGLQGYERAYYFYLLGTYISPHKLSLQISYDYQPGINQQSMISPFNYNAPWGGYQTWGASSTWGGTSTLEQWKIHLQRQTCQAFQITMNEIYDPSYGTAAGAGLTLSGINCALGIKKGWRPIGSKNSVG